MKSKTLREVNLNLQTPHYLFGTICDVGVELHTALVVLVRKMVVDLGR